MRRRVIARTLICAVTLAMVGSACSRSDSDSGGGSSSTTSGGGGTASGSFASLGKVCGPGDAKGATDLGVTDTEIRVGTVSDPGFAGRPGLNQELHDAATVFTEWCNAAGGIAGRKIKLDLLDAKLTEYRQRILEACDQDFSLVGGGAVFDDTGQKDRIGCLLPDIAGYVVSPQARGSELLVQVMPNPNDEINNGDMQWLAKKFPEAAKRVAAMTAGLPSTIVVKDQAVEGGEAAGMTVVADIQYNANGESTWAPIVQSLKSKGVKGILWTGEPENLAKLEQGLKDANYPMDFIRPDANHYDQKLLDTGGKAIENTFVHAQIYPFEQAAENPATQQYLDLFKKYLPNGKAKSYLGVQAFSAWLLFAKGATACGSKLTRSCILEKTKQVGGTSWTGGGLHGASNVREQQATECFTVFKASPKGFSLPDIEANDSIYNCAPGNVLKLKGDYGKGVTLADVGKSLSDLK
ncbi:MAG: ABC transporter substrate-binding protein [Actinomycetes bacterium]